MKDFIYSCLKVLKKRKKKKKKPPKHIKNSKLMSHSELIIYKENLKEKKNTMVNVKYTTHTVTFLLKKLNCLICNTDNLLRQKFQITGCQ